jgi:flagellar biosynthetic protein FliR
VVGVALGIVAAVPFAAARAAGALVDRARDPDGRGPLGTLFSLMALALFAAMNGPRLLVIAVAQSYVAFPVGGNLAPGAAVALEAGARLIGAGLVLAAPALAAMVLVELMLGLVARAQPAVGEAVEAAPLRTLTVVIVLGLATVTLAGALLGEGGLRGLAGALADAVRML